MVEDLFHTALEYAAAHVEQEVTPVNLANSLSFFDTLWVSDPIAPPAYTRLNEALDAKDVFDGTTDEAYLADLDQKQIPAMRVQIQTALENLDPIRDKAIIEELNTLDEKLAEIQSKTRHGLITPREAYTQITDALKQMRGNVFKEVNAGQVMHSERHEFPFETKTKTEQKDTGSGVMGLLRRVFPKQ